MPYIVDPTNPLSPANSDGARQGAEEFRALKAYIATLAGLPAGLNLYRRNILINGAMDIWQRGNKTTIGDGEFAADRFIYSKNGGMVHNVFIDGNTPADAGTQFQSSMILTCTTPDGAITAGNYCTIGQKVEGYNYRALAFRDITFSFWIRSPIVGTYCIAARNGGADRSYVAEFTVDTVNTWERKSIVIVAPAVSIADWDFGATTGIEIRLVLACGTTFQTIPGVWQTGNFLGTVNQVNATSATGDIYTTGWQLEAGTFATEFDFVPINQVYQECKRYYQRYGQSNEFPYIQGNATGAGNRSTTWLLPVEMLLGPPTITKVGATWGVVNCGQPTFSATLTSMRMTVAVTGAGAFSSFPDSVGEYVELVSEL